MIETAPPTSSTQLLTLGEVADRLGVGAKLVRAYLDSGALPVVNVAAKDTRRCLRVRESDLERFIETRLAGV